MTSPPKLAGHSSDVKQNKHKTIGYRMQNLGDHVESLIAYLTTLNYRPEESVFIMEIVKRIIIKEENGE